MSSTAKMSGGKKVKGKRKRKSSAAVSSAAESKFLKEFDITVDDISDVSDAESPALEAEAPVAVKKKKKSAVTDDDEVESAAKKQKVADSEDSESESEDVGSYGIYIGGISYDASEDDLGVFFESCGEITSVRMPRYLPIYSKVHKLTFPCSGIRTLANLVGMLISIFPLQRR